MRVLPACVLVLACVTCFSTITAEAEDAAAPPIGLHMAVLQGNVDAVRQHIEAGSDLNQKDAFGSSPLILASVFGKTEVAQVLIDAGADLHIRNTEGGTPLHVAAFLCRTQIVQALLDAGADLRLTQKELEEIHAVRIESRVTDDELRAVHAKVFWGMLSRFVEDALIDQAEVDRLHQLHGLLHQLGWAPGEPPYELQS